MEGEMEKLTFLFFGADNKPYFSRDDAEQAEHDHSQMSLFLLFPYREDKVITHGMRVGYVDALGDFQAFEIRKARNYEADHYQEITAEHIAISELTDEHFPPAEWDNVTAETALRQLLQGTGWQVGNVTASGTSSGSVSMGNVWQDIRTIEQNWNVYITPRIVMAAGGISQRFLDISPAGGTWRGLRLSLEKNLDDAGVTWDDTNLKTALYGYGKGQTVEGSTENTPLTFENVVWTDTRNAAGTTGHPAKPKGQKYLEDDRATRDYGRNGRPRFGFYQNGDIDDPNILIEKTWETLKTVSVPDVTIDGTVRDLYRLGLTDVPIRLHDTALVEIRPTGVTLQKEIIRYLEDLLNPMTSHLTIGAYIPNIIYINREMADQTYGGAGGRGSGSSQSNEEYKREEFHTDIEANKHKISLSATQEDMSKVQGILMQAGLEIDANGVLQYATDEANKLMVKVQTTAQQYAVEAVQNNMSGYLQITALKNEMGNVFKTSDGKTIVSSIVTTINGENSEIYLNSDHVKLKDGSIITASTLDARLADIDALFTTNGYSKTIVTNSMTAKTSMTSPTISADNFYFRNENGGLGDRMGTKQVQFFKGGAYQAIKPVGIGSDTVMNLRHSHEITITELSGANAGKIQITMGEAVATNSADRIKNFKIADTSYYQAGVSAARSSVVVNAVNWNTPNITENAQKEHGKYASISGTVQLAYQTGVDGGGNPIMTNIGNPIGIGPQEITSVYNTGFEDGAVAGGAAVVQRTAANLKAAITLPASHTGKATISDNIVVYSDTTESSNFPVEIDASAVYAAGKNNVKPTNTPTGWRWVASGNDNVLQNIVTAANPNVPTETAKQTAVTVSFPDLTQEVTSSQAIVKALDGVVAAFAINKGTATPNAPGSAAWNSSTHQYTITADGAFSVGGVSIAQNQGSMTFTPSNAFTYAFNQCYGSIGLSEASQELNPGDSVTIYPKAYSTYDVSINPNAQPQNITTKGITITAKQAATVTPKVSKKTWSSSGTLTFEASTASGDPTSAGVALGWITVPNTSNGNASLSVVDKASPYSSAQPHTVLTKDLTLTCEDDAAYLKDGGTTIAKVPNNKTAAPVTVNVEKGSWSSGAIQFTTDPASGTGKNVSLGMTIPANTSNGNAQITIVDKASPGSSSQPLSTGLTKTLTLTCEDDAAYLKDGNTTVAKVPNNKTTPTVSASIDMIELRTVGGVQYRYDKTEKDYTIYVQASGTNVSPKTDGQLHIGGSAAFNHGRDSVTITNVERIASCAFDHDAQTAKQDVRFTLSNGETYTIHEDFSDVYRAGRNGTAIDTFVDYAVDLSSGGVVFDPGVEEDADGDPLRIDLSDIYQAGQNYTPPVKHWYTYSSTGGDVPIYVRGGGSGSGDGVIGSIYEHLNQFHASTSIAFYPYTPVEVVGSLLGYTQVSYNGSTYYVDPSNLTQSETDLSIGHRIGIKDLTAYAVSTTMTGLIHTGGATSGISVYLEPYNGTAKNYTSSYVPSSDFSSYRANGSASSYFYEMAAKSGYYGRHEKTAYSGDIQHKAIFEILYSDGNTETVVVSFNSYAKAADEVVYTYPGYIDANNYVNLRSTDSTAGTVLAQVPDRSTVMCQYNPNGYTGTWMPVQYGGKTGYIQSKFIEGTKDWNDLNTKTISTITLVGVAHAMGSSKKDITVTLRPQKNGMKFTTSYATESNEYTYDWAVTNTDTDTYLLHPASGCYMYHSKSAYSSTMRMRVKLNVTYTNSSKFPPETVVLQVDSIAK